MSFRSLFWRIVCARVLSLSVFNAGTRLPRALNMTPA
jgi:hypothetical protein